MPTPQTARTNSTDPTANAKNHQGGPGKLEENGATVGRFWVENRRKQESVKEIRLDSSGV